METQTTIRNHHENQLTEFCPFNIQEQEDIQEYASAATYEEFLTMLRKVFTQLNMEQIFRIPRG